MNSPIYTQLRELGVGSGDILLVHSSFKSLDIRDPEQIIEPLLAALGPGGTLLMPALTYLQQPAHFHDARHAPSCVGFLTEYFRTRPGTLRSLHPTHSVCAVGAQAAALLSEHDLDRTPCGAHSPFNRLMQAGGKILMLGCGTRPNTTMHAVEEYVPPPYLFGTERDYVITDADGRTFRETYVTHGFRGYQQRYDRVAGLLDGDALRTGLVGAAQCHLLDAWALLRAGVAKLQDDPFFFVERAESAG